MQKYHHFTLPCRKRLAASRLGNGPAAAKQAKTTEEMELDKIRAMREELENRKKQFADSYQKAMTITAAPARAKAPTTRPKEFHFTSDQRIKGHQRTSSGTEPKEFSRSLRSSTSAAVSVLYFFVIIANRAGVQCLVIKYL